tara:strand:+ start:234 stop:1220 length:987 start_codon:yes stop_codon:yes gene_type:complete
MNVAKIISDNTCVQCGNIVNENLRKWFKDKWVNIGKKKKGGGHPPCGTSGKKRGYAKCVPKSKAANMTKKQKASATRRKRAAQNKAGRGGTDSTRGGGKKPINVKTKAESKMNLESYIGKMMTEAQFDEAAGKKDACYRKVKARYDVWPSAYASGALVKCRKVGAKNWGNKSKKEGYPGISVKDKDDKNINECWVGYKQIGMKDKGGKQVPNCVKEVTEIFYEVDGKGHGYTFEYLRLPEDLNEAEYQGRKVKLGKPTQGDVKKFKVYVKNPKGNVVKVNFGQGGDAKGGTMKIRKSNPKARASFRARHNCDNPGPRHKARYWSCRKW